MTFENNEIKELYLKSMRMSLLLGTTYGSLINICNDGSPGEVNSKSLMKLIERLGSSIDKIFYEKDND